MSEPRNIDLDPKIVDLSDAVMALWDAVDALTAKIENTGQKSEKVTSNLKEYNRVYQQGLRAGRREGAKILRHDPRVGSITHTQFIDRIQNAPFEDLEFLEILSDLVERRINALKHHSKD